MKKAKEQHVTLCLSICHCHWMKFLNGNNLRKAKTKKKFTHKNEMFRLILSYAVIWWIRWISNGRKTKTSTDCNLFICLKKYLMFEYTHTNILYIGWNERKKWKRKRKMNVSLACHWMCMKLLLWFLFVSNDEFNTFNFC